jgi:hypothetical protein
MAQPSDQPDASANAFESAQQQWPILRNQNILSKFTPRQSPEKLEAWPPGEAGTVTRPRPQEFPTDSYGIEVYNHTRPIDVLGDVVSHFLVDKDPEVRKFYNEFNRSITPQQERHVLGEHFLYDKAHGDKRSYQDWRRISGLPAYFRGHPFQQWPENYNKRVYTPQQRELLDRMMRYLSADPERQQAGASDAGEMGRPEPAGAPREHR